MVLQIDRDLEVALNERARLEGVAPEILAIEALRQRVMPKSKDLVPRDDWERELLALARPCGISLSDADAGRESLYG